MRFSQIILENWRNFEHVDVRLQNRVFLVGPNASGKSNFLDALRFLRDVVTSGGGFKKSVDDRGGVSRIRNLAARRYPDVVVEVALQEKEDVAWRYRLAFSQDNQRIPVLQAEKVWRGEELILDRPNDKDRTDEALLRQTYLEQTIANRDFRPIADFFASIRYYHIVPQLVRDPERSIGRQADPYGGDFLEQIAGATKRTRDARLRRILAARQVILSTHSSDLLRDEGIAADEVLLVVPSKEGSVVRVGADVVEVKQLFKAGLTAAEAVIPHTRPADAIQLSLFGD